MDYRQLFWDVLTLNVSSLRIRLLKLAALIRRSLFLKGIKSDEEIKNTPIIINNRNRYAHLLKLIGWLESNGMKNIHIIDNDSTYPPLLEYYKKTPYKVYFLKKNVGHLALWKSFVYEMFKNDYYVYTDADILPVQDCPGDALKHFYILLQKYKGIEKAGFGLRIDDLPDHYENKQKVIDWESKFWTKKVEEEVYDAAIDTTFALYRPFTNGEKWVAPSYRTGGKYIARHLPWYENTSKPEEEEIFYAGHVKAGASHWIPIKKSANE